MKFVSLFAGIGGFDLGFERAGMECLAHVEIDPKCRTILKPRFPNAETHDDITTFKPNRSQFPADVVCGGSPCQDLSVAGLRAGMDGKRSGLFFEMVRVCKRLRPRFVVWENVDGAFSSQEGRDFQSVLHSFTGITVEIPDEGWGNAGFVRSPFACRWNVAWRVFDSQYFGVPQRRRRVFLVGSLGDASCLEILFEPESVRGDSPPSREARKGIADGIAARAGVGGYEISPPLTASARGTERTGESRRQDCVIPVVAATLRSGSDNPASHGKQNGTDRETLIPEIHCREVAHAVVCHQAKGGDPTTDNYIAELYSIMPMNSGKDYKARRVEVAQPLMTSPVGGNQGGDYVLDFSPKIAVNTGQGFWKEAENAATLGAGPRAVHENNLLAFSCKDHGADASAINPTLRAMSHAGSHENGGGQVAVIFQESQTGVREYADAGTQRANGPGHDPVGSRVREGMSVRRLTPTECLRLQSFPDDWPEIDGVRPSDSSIYKQAGNAVTVNVLEWIGKRIVKASK